VVWVFADLPGDESLRGELTFTQSSTAMVVRFHDDPELFEEVALPFLLGAEAENNLMLGLLRQIAEGAFDEFWLASVEHAGSVVGCALQTPPHWVLLTQAPSAGIAELVAELVRRLPRLGGIIGPASACEVFAETWCWETNASSSLHMAQGIFQLERVEPPKRPAPGLMRVARAGDVETIALWHEAFVNDTGIPDARDGSAVARRNVEEGSLFVWEVDGTPVSVAAWAGPTPHGVRVNFVYTPPESRGRGYATTCVAALSQHLLDKGHTFCFLYTDLNNPTSNAIYTAIGYRKVSESVVLVFDYA
jgi:uncharacterized protein